MASERTSLPAAGLRRWDRGARPHSEALRPQSPARACRHCAAPQALSPRPSSKVGPLIPRSQPEVAGRDCEDQPLAPLGTALQGQPSSLCGPRCRPASPLPPCPLGGRSHARRRPRRTHSDRCRDAPGGGPTGPRRGDTERLRQASLPSRTEQATRSPLRLLTGHTDHCCPLLVPTTQAGLPTAL